MRPSGSCLAASFIGDASILCVSRIIAKIQPPLRNQRQCTSRAGDGDGKEIDAVSKPLHNYLYYAVCPS